MAVGDSETMRSGAVWMVTWPFAASTEAGAPTLHAPAVQVSQLADGLESHGIAGQLEEFDLQGLAFGVLYFHQGTGR